MRLKELNEMLATVKARREEAEGKAQRYSVREKELADEIKAEREALEAALKEAS